MGSQDPDDDFDQDGLAEDPGMSGGTPEAGTGGPEQVAQEHAERWRRSSRTGRPGNGPEVPRGQPLAYRSRTARAADRTSSR